MHKRMTCADNVLQLVGNTPLVRMAHLDTGSAELYAKLENLNPGGSIKDRVALSMIDAAEQEGKIKPGTTLIEATAGNTGIGLALVAAQKGYRLLLVIPDKMSQEKIFNLKSMGAEVITTRSDVAKGHPDYYQDVAARLAHEIPNAFFINQFSNPANVQAHFNGTGPEIWQQMEQKVDAIVCGVGSGGTLSGIGRYIKSVSPQTKMVLADPKGSILAHYVKTGQLIQPDSWLVEGIGEDFVPSICDLSLVDEAYTITDAESFEYARLLLKEEGISGGSSSGTLLAAALQYCRGCRKKERVVTLVPDTGNRYLTKMYNDYWLLDQGFIERKPYYDLRDLIARRHQEHATVTIQPKETLLAAYSRMKLHEISQLPVLQDEKIIGIIDEADILMAVYEHENRFRDSVNTAMITNLETIHYDKPLKALISIFEKNHVAIVMDGEQFLGVITRIDLLNYLRKSLQ